MAPSPTPDTSVLDPKQVPDKEPKADVNGHVSPAVASSPEAQAESKSEPKSESKPESQPESAEKNKTPQDEDETPLVNGKSSPGDAVTNGVAKTNGEDTKKEEAVDDSKPPQSPESPPVKTDEKTAETTEEKKAEESTVKEEAPSQATGETAQEMAKSEDVQMTDATNANDTTTTEPARDESAPKPSAPAEAKTDVDTAMADEKPSDESTKPSKPEKTETPAGAPSEVDLGPASMSQLAIESAGPSPIETSIEVSMTDAPPSAKVAREREDDFGDDEPAPKRAKTEPKDEEPSGISAAGTPAAGTPAAGTPAPSGSGGGLRRLLALAKWEDVATHAKKITPFQRREIRKVIGRVKKTKHGGHFRDSVPKLWPQLGESYLARIDRPMDLSEIDRNLRDPNVVYATFGDMRKDLSLIFENTLTFNGVSHEVTESAYYAIRAVWQDSMVIPEEEPQRPKSVAKPKPPREPRAFVDPETHVRRQSSGPVSSPPPREVPEQKPRPPTVMHAQNIDRRSSTATEADRPKRTVRAPKPKDIDYTTKPSRKKLRPELQFGDEVLAELMHPKNQALNSWFLDAVDAEGLNIPHYYSIIKKPMDLGKVLRMLNGGEITSLKEFDKIVRLIFSNCYEFNGPPDQGNPVSLVARQLEELYNQQMRGRDAWLARYAKANAPAPSASTNPSDDDDDDDSEDDDRAGGGGGGPGVDNSKEIQELNSKLDEESRKLNRLFASGASPSLIECQKAIVDAVQKALYTAAQGESKSKQDKVAKKSSKSSKSKTSSSVPSRKVTTIAPPPKKLSSGTKKQPTHQRRTLSAADKDQIASAINDLEYPHLDRAIDIIKRDTGQNENNDGELELDIDQLSNDALLKLWDLCKKVLPGFGKDSVVAPRSPDVNRAVPAKQAPKSAAPKSKKNKPMSAQEQEARIAQLTAISQLYKPGQEPADDATHAPTPNHHDESSDDSDSEEE